MFVMVRIEVDDETRGRIRAGEGRYGLATREEVRDLALERFASHVRTLPAPKRRRTAVAVGREVVRESDLDRAEAFAQQHVTDDTVCERCGCRRHEHGSLAGFAGKSCPLSKQVKPGSTFSPRASIRVEGATW